MDFTAAIEIVLKHEGGYVDHPNDPGGETKYGITKRTYPDLDIKSLTRDQAVQIYKRDFWDRYHLDKIPAAIRLQLFDMIVNAGPSHAVKLLQKALITMGYKVSIDGAIGPKTIDAARVASPAQLADKYALQRIQYYVTLAGLRPSMKVFLLGWLRRALSVAGVS